MNEDACECIEERGTLCCIVADGLGGQHGGEIASSLTTTSIVAAFRAGQSCEEGNVGVLLRVANEAILERQRTIPALSSMRCTAVLLLADGKQAVWGHVGDSRLYRFAQGRVVFQTKDHSVPQALSDAGKILPADIRFHEDRNRLLRSLGSNCDLRPVLAEHLLGPDDVFLLCTDGFWEYVTETEMEVELAKSSGPDEWLERMSGRIVRRAPAGHDNYSAVAIWRE